MKLVRIFLSSLLLWSCEDNRTVRVYVLDRQKQAAYQYEIVGLNKKTGELVLKDQPNIFITSPTLDSAVCVSKTDYSYLNYLFKKYFWYANKN